MNYFQGLGIVFGLVAMLKPVYMHLLPYDENRVLSKAYSRKRPAWVIPVAVLGLALVAFTWVKHFTTDIPYSLVITLLFSLTAIKALLFIFDYQKFQKWVAGMLADKRGKKVVVVDLFVGLFGLVVIAASLVFY